MNTKQKTRQKKLPNNNNRVPKNQNARNLGNGNKYKDPDFEFDGIIESEGVLEIMLDGYGFYVLQITIIYHLQMIFMFLSLK